MKILSTFYWLCDEKLKFILHFCGIYGRHWIEIFSNSKNLELAIIVEIFVGQCVIGVARSA